MPGFSIYDFSDRELLWKVADALDQDGFVTSPEIARSMGLDEVEARKVGARLAWMRRYGTVEKNGTREGSTRWTLTPFGRELLDGKLRNSATVVVEGLSDSQRVTVMESLGARAKRNPRVGNVIRRSWINKTGGKL